MLLRQQLGDSWEQGTILSPQPAAGAAVGTKPHVGRRQSTDPIPPSSPGPAGEPGVLRRERMIKNKLAQARGTETVREKILSRNVEE